MEVFRKYQADVIKFTEPNLADFIILQQGLGRNAFPKNLLDPLAKGLRDIEETVQPSAQFAEVIRTFTRPIPIDGTVLFLACGRGVELMRAREVYKMAKFIAVEKQVSPMLAVTAHVSNTTLWTTDLTDIDPEELKGFVGKTPDLTVIRMPHPGDHFWGNYITHFAKAALEDKKQLLVTNLNTDERKRVLGNAQLHGIPLKMFFYNDAPRIDMGRINPEYKQILEEEGIEVGHDFVVTVIG